jgi:adiponectin receptor
LALVLVFSVLTMMVSLWEKFAEPDYRLIRALVFAAYGLSAIIPVFHWAYTRLGTDANLRMSLICLLIMGACYILGGVLYAARIPERYFPGKCDYWFQSHQLFHCLVIAAAVVHYKGVSAIATHNLELNDVCESDLIY